MATIKVFEELVIWKLAFAQCQDIFDALLENTNFTDLPLKDQINRASGSVMDNIAEGFDRFSRADFRHFLMVARGSNAEVRSQLYRAKARLHISEEIAERMLEANKLLGRKITSLIKHLDTSTYKSKPASYPQSAAEAQLIYSSFNEDIPELSDEHLH